MSELEKKSFNLIEWLENNGFKKENDSYYRGRYVIYFFTEKSFTFSELGKGTVMSSFPRPNTEEIWLYLLRAFNLDEVIPKKLIINAVETLWYERYISYEDLAGKLLDYTITYRHGIDNEEGSLMKGRRVQTKDGMIFNVHLTNNA